MRNRKALVCFILSALVSPLSSVWAASPIDGSANYQSGKELCQHQPGAWIKVPSAYDLQLNPHTQKYELKDNFDRGETEIFYSVYSDGQNLGAFLRPGKPSILYFEGGPAGIASTRSQFFKDQSAALDVNIITFEVRGVSCSRPESDEVYHDGDFHSGFHITADAHKVIEHLGVQEVLVYGLSYGTFPARLFGYFYPEKTKSLLLEGVLTLNHNQRVEGAPLLESLKRLYSAHFFKSPRLVLQFFSYMAQQPTFQPWMNAYLGNLSRVASYFGARGLDQYFSDLMAHSDSWEEFTQLVATYPVNSPWRSNVAAGYDSNIDLTIFEMLLCRDFDRRASLSSNPVTVNSSGQIEVKAHGGFTMEWNHYFETSCLEQKRSSEQSLEAMISHHGGKLPLEMPVLMFNGGLDFITPSLAAQREAEIMNTHRLTFLEFEREGHAPWNLIHLFGAPEQKLFLDNLLKVWVATGDVDLSAQDFEFMEKAHIRSAPISQ